MSLNRAYNPKPHTYTYMLHTVTGHLVVVVEAVVVGLALGLLSFVVVCLVGFLLHLVHYQVLLFWFDWGVVQLFVF